MVLVAGCTAESDESGDTGIVLEQDGERETGDQDRDSPPDLTAKQQVTTEVVDTIRDDIDL